LGEKTPKKDNNPKCKVNTLACYMLFGPNNQFKQVLQSLRKKKTILQKSNLNKGKLSCCEES
jgi:hypothetical protein